MLRFWGLSEAHYKELHDRARGESENELSLYIVVQRAVFLGKQFYSQISFLEQFWIVLVRPNRAEILWNGKFFAWRQIQTELKLTTKTKSNSCWMAA